MADLRSAPDLDVRVAEAFDRLATFVIAEHSFSAALQLIVDLAASAVQDADGVSISIKKNGKVLTAVSSNAKAVELDQLQYDAAAGPCLQAIQDASMQLTQSLLTDDRWPEFTNKALYAGAISILAVPIKSSGEVLGALNFFSSRENAFTDGDLSVAQAFTERSAAVLLNVKVYEELTELAAQLQEALQSRAVIDQAKGIIMATEHVSADAAFDRLRRLSQKSNVKVRELARRLVDGVQSK